VVPAAGEGRSTGSFFPLEKLRPDLTAGFLPSPQKCKKHQNVSETVTQFWPNGAGKELAIMDFKMASTLSPIVIKQLFGDKLLLVRILQLFEVQRAPK
jgi:hypothetical protein